MNGQATAQLFELLFTIAIPGLLVALGWGVGRVVERRHLARLDARQAALPGMMVTDLRCFPGGADPSAGATLVTAEAVISADYFKSFLAKIRGIFGGELRSYRSMMDRARREATLRLMEQSRHLGFDALCNVRLDTADIAGAQRRKAGVVMVCIMASGTAYRKAGPAATPTARAGALAAGTPG